MPATIKLIVGLGNPGAEHAETRHNAGFWFADRLAEKYSLQFRSEARFQSEVCRIQTPDIDCWLCKPQTFMNVSGQAVQSMATFYKISIDEIMVAHDEIDLDAGTVRLKKDGGHGGHNGLRDIIEKMNANNFIRLRIGVSHPGSKEAVTPHVLGRPDAQDRKLIDETIDSAIKIMPQIFAGEIQKAMTALHTVKHETSAD